MDNKLSQNFNAYSLIKFTLPTTIMLVFMSLYQMVDGVFVANFVGANALSALNIVYPAPSIIIAVSIMLASGGSAIIAKNMGEKKAQEAKENFSMIILTGFIFGIAFLILGTFFLKQIILMLGATPNLYDYCYDYLLILVLSSPLAVFQMLFQTFFVTAGKPHIGLAMTITGGCANTVLDYLFIAVLQMGVTGAALATAIGYSIPGIFGLLYFTFNRKGTLYLVKPVFRKRILLYSCANGSSEMVNNIAVSITTFLFNVLMLKYMGEPGVAAITIVLYAQFLMTSVFMGFSTGIAPIISYNYGKQNNSRLQNLFRISIRMVVIISASVFIIAEVFSPYIVRAFAAPESEVFQIAKHGFALFSISFLFTGVNIFSSAMFTAFSDGKISAVISFLRTFVFLVLCLLALPVFLDIDGLWMAVPVAEGLAFIVCLYYLAARKNVYHYMEAKSK